MTNAEKKILCRRCTDDYYNLPGNSTRGECWSLESAKVVERTKVGTWQNPPYKWEPKKTLSCHKEPGYAWIRREDVRITRTHRMNTQDELNQQIKDATSELNKLGPDLTVDEAAFVRQSAETLGEQP